jgi:hypothetical protein
MGVLYGDGFISISEPDPVHGRRRKGSLGLKTTNASFADAFRGSLKATFGLPTRRHSRIEPLKVIGGRVYRNKRYHETFLHQIHTAAAVWDMFGPTTCHDWMIDVAQCLRLGREFCLGLLQGLVDSEGSISRAKKSGLFSLRLEMANGPGMASLHELILALGYNASLHPQKNGTLRIGFLGGQAGVARYAREIGSRIDYKAKLMRDCLERAERKRS